MPDSTKTSAMRMRSTRPSRPPPHLYRVIEHPPRCPISRPITLARRGRSALEVPESTTRKLGRGVRKRRPVTRGSIAATASSKCRSWRTSTIATRCPNSRARYRADSSHRARDRSAGVGDSGRLGSRCPETRARYRAARQLLARAQCADRGHSKHSRELSHHTLGSLM